jgi:hypothetical protein
MRTTKVTKKYTGKTIRLGDEVDRADMVNHPPHYTTGQIETLDYILDKCFGYLDGQVIKYISRFRYKGAPLEDLRKAQFYLNRLIEYYEGL